MIKIAKHVLSRSILLLLLVIVALSIGLQLFGKTLLERVLTRQFNQKVSISYLFYHFPFGLNARVVKVGNILQAKKVNAYFDFSAILKKKVFIERLIIYNGKLAFPKKVNDKEVIFTLSQINLTLTGIPFPLESQKTNFVGNAYIEKNEVPISASHVKALGWINLLTKDVEGRLLFSKENKKSEFLAVDMLSNAGEITVAGQFKLSGLPQENLSLNLVNPLSRNSILMKTINALGVNITAKFSFKTRFDNFKVENIAIEGDVYSNQEIMEEKKP